MYIKAKDTFIEFFLFMTCYSPQRRSKKKVLFLALFIKLKFSAPFKLICRCSPLIFASLRFVAMVVREKVAKRGWKGVIKMSQRNFWVINWHMRENQKKEKGTKTVFSVYNHLKLFCFCVFTKMDYLWGVFKWLKEYHKVFFSSWHKSLFLGSKKRCFMPKGWW